MVTFGDVTDSVHVESALLEKNEALRRADQLTNDFVQHVSYELRSPLTNIIGFTELLAQPATGPLTARQRDYVGHIGSSSSVLLTFVNPPRGIYILRIQAKDSRNATTEQRKLLVDNPIALYWAD